MPLAPPAFVATTQERRAFDAWRTRIESMGLELGEADAYVVGLLATREVRLTVLGKDLARAKGTTERLRVASAERMAALDLAKVLDQAQRIFGDVRLEAEGVAATSTRATGTHGRVVSFPGRDAGPVALGPVGQRILAAVAAGPRTKAQLRATIRGNDSALRDGLRDALRAGAIVREGIGSKGKPFTYRRAR